MFLFFLKKVVFGSSEESASFSGFQGKEETSVLFANKKPPDAATDVNFKLKGRRTLAAVGGGKNLFAAAMSSVTGRVPDEDFNPRASWNPDAHQQLSLVKLNE